MGSLTTDFPDRHGELVGRGSRCGNAAGCLHHGIRHNRCLRSRLFGGGCHRPRSCLQLSGCSGNTVDDFADGGFETLCKAYKLLPVLTARCFSLLSKLFDLARRMKKYLERPREFADLVLSVRCGNMHVFFAFGQAAGNVGHLAKGARNVARENAMTDPGDHGPHDCGQEEPDQ